MYTWWNFVESFCSPAKKILRINLDETSVKTWMPSGKGLVTRRIPGPCRGDRRVAPATRKQQRGCLSHVAFVCDQPEIQPHLPHVIIGNECVLPLYIQREMETQLSSNVFLVRRKSAWVDAHYMAAIIKLLGAMLAPFLDRFQPILLMDALPAHLAPEVFRAAARAAIWVVIVPAKLTWLIQPADTHAFFKYKMHLRRHYMRAMSRSPDGCLQLREVLKAVNDGVRYVFQAHDWSKAFAENGFGHKQQFLRQTVAQSAGLRLPLSIPSAMPTLMQMRSIWPGARDVPLSDVFAPFLPSAEKRATSFAVAEGIHGAAHHAPAPVPNADSWAERLRPRRSGSFVFPPVYEVVGDSPARDISASSSAAWPPPAAAQPAAVARPAQRLRLVARPIAASRRSGTTFAPTPATGTAE